MKKRSVVSSRKGAGTPTMGSSRSPRAVGRGARIPAFPAQAKRPPEAKICGVNACLSRFSLNSDSIVRAYFLEDTVKLFKPLIRELARTRRAYHVVSAEELAKISGTLHHEGVCLLARVSDCLRGHEVFESCGDGPLLILDGVLNPHNLGALARVGAHYGVQGAIVLVDDDAEASFQNSSFFRVAQGGAEHLQWGTYLRRDVARLFHELEDRGFELAGTSSHGPDDLFDTHFASRVAFVLGSESTGLSPEVERLLTLRLRIPGTGLVESLNVACAASGLLMEHWRQTRVQSSPRQRKRPQSGPELLVTSSHHWKMRH